jgi:phospholipid N-methyltransferase
MSFITQVFSNINTIGAVAPSSKYLTQKMIKPIDFENAEIIVELGAGTGVMTKAILKKMKPNARLISFEINTDFIENLEKINDPRFLLLNESVENFKSILENLGINKVDYVVSGLPIAILKDLLVNKLLAEVSTSLNENGKFIQFQYSKFSLKDLKKHFQQVETDFTALNLPPAWVYVCQ